MNNYEKYRSEIEAIWENNDLAVVNNEPTCCRNTDCDDCDADTSNCTVQIQKWLVSEYKEQKEVDWSKVEVDTPILVSDDGVMWYRRHFARHEDDRVWAWTNGGTSWVCENDKDTTIQWKYARIAEVE